MRKLITTTILLLTMLNWANHSFAQQQTPSNLKPLVFTTKKAKLAFSFKPASPNNSLLTELRKTYELDNVVAGKNNDYEKLRAISKWIRSRWEHNGSNQPIKSDSLSILKEAAEGKRFRCVEYSIVLSDALNAIGIPARVLTLKTADAETRESGAGHVVAEAYLKDLKKWVMLDGQFDVIPTLKGKPLNAVEFQKALAEFNPNLNLDSFSKVKKIPISNG